MSVKIINVLKDDSFNDILDIFRSASASEVIVVLPRVGRLFRHDDHFAAFASEAKQAGKTVSVLTPNAATAEMARRHGFGVMTSSPGKTSKTAKLATAPMPSDDDIMSHDDTADLGDVPVTSDEAADVPIDTEEADPLRGMHIEDAEGNPVDDDGDGKPDKPDDDDLTVGDASSFVSARAEPVTAVLAAAPKPARPPQPNDIDGVRISSPTRSLTPASPSEPEVAVPLSKPPVPSTEPAADLDYIDAVWRDRNGHAPVDAISETREQAIPAIGGFFSGAARIASGNRVSKRVAFSILAGAVIVLASVVYLMTGSAYVAIAPIGSTVDTQITVQASDTFTSVDDAFAKIPGQLIEVSKSAEKTVKASGTRDVASKARGKITVYNEYSSTPQTLVATTRFQADNGNVYRTLQTITVPGSTIAAGQAVPGSVSVDVIADAPGTGHNIPAGRFIILAFKERGEQEKVEKFYGKSESPMSGGASGPSAVVTQADYDAAKEQATAAVREQVTAALQAQGAGLMVLDADKPVMADVKTTANPDDAAESVTVTATGTITTIAFRTQDLMDLIGGTMLKKDRLIVLPNALELSYGDIAFKPDLGTLTFTVTLKGTGYAPVDTEAIKKDIAGKNGQSIRDYFRDKEGIQSATVTLSPFWVRNVPEKTEKIRIELLYGDGPQTGR